MTFLTRRRIQLANCGAITALVVLLFVVGAVGVQQHIGNREAVNRIDYTGQLRMLGQRVVQKTIVIHDRDISPAVDSQLAVASKQFETILSGLKNGNTDLELRPARDSATLAAIGLIESRWRELSEPLARPRSGSANDPHARLTVQGDQLLRACQQLMIAERRDLVAGQVHMFQIFWVCMVALLLLGTSTQWLLRRERRLIAAEEASRKSAELLAATRQSEARLKTLMASSMDPLLTISARGIVQTASDSVETFGWTPQELIGQNVKILMPEPYRSEHDEHLARYRHTGMSHLLGKPRELPAMHRDGTVFPAIVTIWKVDLPDQSEPLFMGIIRDITERKRSEAELESLHRQLVDTARQAGKAEVATSVLHNVGNVLNSVNVSAGMIRDGIRGSGVSHLTKVVNRIEQHFDDLGTYLTQDERGKHLPRFLIDLGRQMATDEETILEEVVSLIGNIDHINTIVSTQQSYASGVSGLVEAVSLSELLEDAIHINVASMKRHSVRVVRQFDDVGPVITDKQRLLQIVVNLISNAKYACLESDNESNQLTVSLRRRGEDRVRIEVRDNGTGIAPENLTRVFAHGFTTRKEGHGFGLHSAVLAAKELDGSLTAASDGAGKGATFTLEFPCREARKSLCTT